MRRRWRRWGWLGEPSTGGSTGGSTSGSTSGRETNDEKSDNESNDKSPIKKKSCNKRSPCISMDEANAKFLQRCQASGTVSPTCHPHCRYDEDTPTLKKAFLGGGCKLAELRPYLTCASNGKDNTACCSDSGVLSQKRTDVCGCFCNPTGPVWPQKGEAGKYGPCVGVLSGIMTCHYWAEGAD